MFEENYKLGVLKALEDNGIVKESGAKHIVGGALGALLGSAVGGLALPALGESPKGILGFPPTQGQLEHDIKKKKLMGMLLGGIAGAGAGLASPKIMQLMKNSGGGRIKDILSA
jgi:hypothetical protein